MQSGSSRIIPLGSLRLDTVRNVLTGRDGELRLSPIAVRVLEVLSETPGVVVTRNALIERVWDGNALVGEPALNRVISELRKVVGDSASSPSLVQTMPRQGYRLVVDEGGSEAAVVPASPVAVPRATASPWANGWVWLAAGAIGLVLGAGLMSWFGDTAVAVAWMQHHSD